MLDSDFFSARETPPFAALRAFEAVFRTGGIRRAAACLQINHAVVSRHLKRLEDWVGAPLFSRAGSRLQLTEVGTQLHTRVSASFVELAAAIREARGKQADEPLRLTCVPGLSIQWLSAELAAFEKRCPEISVELKPTDHAPNLLAREADVDIRYCRDGSPPPCATKGVRDVELARPTVIPVATRDVAERLDLNQGVGALLEGPLLHEEDREEWRAWLGLNGLQPSGELPGQICWQAHLAIAAARLGRGVALANPFLVRSELSRGELVKVEVPGARDVALGSYRISAREDRWSVPPLRALRGALVVRARTWLAETSAV